jgi:hypothetical protein
MNKMAVIYLEMILFKGLRKERLVGVDGSSKQDWIEYFLIKCQSMLQKFLQTRLD